MTHFPANRITLLTLGVRDLDRSRGFYEALGWVEAQVLDGVAFYQMDGMVMGLFDIVALAADQGRPGAELGTGAANYAQNFYDTTDVDTAWERVLNAGGTILREPDFTNWGGYAGYFADPDGHVWELAYNPHWPMDDQGRSWIPGTE